MWTRNQWIEERNYYNDYRVRNAERYAHRNVDEDRMVIFLTLPDEETGDDVEHEVPAKYDVCPTCEGRGKHVDPSIDASGYSPDEDDYYGDPDEYEEGRSPYERGVYDVPCMTCHGKRVVLEVDTRAADPALIEAYNDYLAECDEYDAMVRAERAFGC